MNPDKKDQPTNLETPESDAPADALSKTPEELAEEVPKPDSNTVTHDEAKKQSAFKRLWQKMNVYVLIFALLLIVAGIVAVVFYLNSQRAPEIPDIANQELTEEALQQLANTDATVGDSAQTLTIQGNAIIEGQTLMRGDLNVAGNIQAGGSLQAPTLTISGTSNLATAQIDSLQVAGNVAVQGTTTLQELNVAGVSSFSGALTASQITVSTLTISGTGGLEIPNHIRFIGATPGSSVLGGPLGGGGSASMSGSDSAGVINVSTGNGPSTGCFIQINFRTAYTSQPRVLVSAVGAAAGRSDHYVERDQNGFRVCFGATPQANANFNFDYFVAG